MKRMGVFLTYRKFGIQALSSVTILMHKMNPPHNCQPATLNSSGAVAVSHASLLCHIANTFSRGEAEGARNPLFSPLAASLSRADQSFHECVWGSDPKLALSILLFVRAG